MATLEEVQNCATPTFGRFAVHMAQQHDMIPACLFDHASVKHCPNLKLTRN